MNTALVIIDVQNGLFGGVNRPFEADEVIERINIISARARELNLPVIFIQHKQSEGLLVEGSEAWQIHNNLIREESDFVIQKTTPDSFLRTELKETLTNKCIDNLIICGYASEFCVDTTTRRAAALGYSVQLIADAHTTHNKEHAEAKLIREHHNATLSDLTSFGPKISLVYSTDLSFMSC